MTDELPDWFREIYRERLQWQVAHGRRWERQQWAIVGASILLQSLVLGFTSPWWRVVLWVGVAASILPGAWFAARARIGADLAELELGLFDGPDRR